MSEDQKVSRREFIVETSSAIVGATAAPGIVDAAQKPKGGTPPPSTFASPAGSTIPFSEQELLATGTVRSFTGPQLGEIAFPLGGIGTGTVSLGGRGEFRDWEIFNRPNKNRSLPFTFVAIWTRRLDGTPVVKVVEAPLRPPFRGGDGVPRYGAAGLPRFAGATFKGAYPFAEIAFEDDSLPVAVALEAFNPFVPLQVDDSALPVAIFRYRVTNRSAAPADVALAFSILNPIGYDGRATLDSNEFAGFGQNMTSLRREAAARRPRHALGQIRDRRHPLRFDGTRDDVPGRVGADGMGGRPLVGLVPEMGGRVRANGGTVADSHTSEPTPDGRSNYATLAPRMTLAGRREPRRSSSSCAWYFPLRENYWNREVEVKGRKLRNHYGTRVQGRLGRRGATPRRNLDAAGEGHARVPAEPDGHARFRGRARRRVEPDVDHPHQHLPAARGTAVLRLRRATTTIRLLPDELHPRLELRAGAGPPVPGARAHDADDRLHRQPRRTTARWPSARCCRRDARGGSSSPPPTARWAAS